MKIVTHLKRLVNTTKVSRPHGDRESVTRRIVETGFTKPDKPTINPREEDGFRKPSGYACPGTSRTGDLALSRTEMYRIYDIVGRGFQNATTEWEFSGSSYVRLRGGLWNISKPNVNALRSKLLNNVRNEVLDVAMVLAEMQGTVDTLTTSLMRLARSMDAVKKGNPRHFSYLLSGRTKDGRRPTDKFLRESSGLFLEWKYGIMPTVMDIQGACKALDMNEDGSFWKNPPLLVARAVEVVEEDTSVRVRVAEASGDSAYIDVPLKTRAEYKARLDYTVEGEGLRGLNRYGIGLSSLPTVLFDRTPFSFVLNMAIPISELIKAWTALTGCEVRGYCETLHERVSYPEDTFSVVLRGVPSAVTLPKQPDWVSWERKAFPSVPMPMPYVRNPIKTGNLATVLALFTQLRSPQGYK